MTMPYATRSGRPEFGPFNIDTDSSDEQYLYVDVPSKQLTVAVKLDDEGIVVDVYPFRVASGPAATLCATYEEVQEVVEEEREYTNYYCCPQCQHEWNDIWTAMCDDDCPECGLRHIEPYQSEEIESGE